MTRSWSWTGAGFGSGAIFSPVPVPHRTCPVTCEKGKGEKWVVDCGCWVLPFFLILLFCRSCTRIPHATRATHPCSVFRGPSSMFDVSAPHT